MTEVASESERVHRPSLRHAAAFKFGWGPAAGGAGRGG